MSLFDFIQLLIFICVLITLVPLLGTYMAKVFRGEKTFLHPILNPLENFSYRIAGINPEQDMTWKSYFKALCLFNFFGLLFLLLIFLFQDYLPFNPEKFSGLSWPLALNAAISFTTNTNWQAFAPEVTLSYAAQMWGITVQSFLSAATGMAALLALVRGLRRSAEEGIGNFWVDCVRSIIYLLLPLACCLAIVLAGHGVIQTLSPYVDATLVESGAVQRIPLGPAASQVAIKQLGTNGGGFFNANSAHPFENPLPNTNFLELLAIVLIPASATYMYGLMVGSRKHGWLLFSTMFVIWVGGLCVALWSEHQNNPLLNALPLLEGKETRIGVMQSVLWSVATTATANGSVNAALTSLSPLSGGVALLNILLNEVAFGGIGVGLISLLMFVFLTVYIAGLMVGRNPQYLGKKIEIKEMQWVSLAILGPAILILTGSGLSVLSHTVLDNLSNTGPHGLTEILYAFASCTANNGSSFTIPMRDNLYFNLFFGACMILGRIFAILPGIAIAGLLCRKKRSTFNEPFFTNPILFCMLLIAVMLSVALTFFPAFCLGPIMENFIMLKGESF